jgi:hypothetical protein
MSEWRIYATGAGYQRTSPEWSGAVRGGGAEKPGDQGRGGAPRLIPSLKGKYEATSRHRRVGLSRLVAGVCYVYYRQQVRPPRCPVFWLAMETFCVKPRMSFSAQVEEHHRHV